MSEYTKDMDAIASLRQQQGGTWDAINPDHAARLRAQNRFHTGLDIARFTAKIMREDMDAYDRDSSQYTQSLGCWHGFIGQQKAISIKKHFGTLKKSYLYLSGWMVAALRSEFGPAAGSVHARKDHRADAHRGTLYLPQAGRCVGTEPLFP